MAIRTDIALTKKEVEIFKKFKALSVNEEPLPQGDGTIRISPFDDYVSFTLFDDTEGEDSPIDLSNVGTISLVFVGENDEIKIPNYTQVQNIDLTQGQVLFRIDKENSKKILALDNNNFYISTQMIDENSTSDETVLYTGKFLGLSDAAQQSLTSKNEELTLEYTKSLSSLQEENKKLKTEKKDLENKLSAALTTITTLQASNSNLTNEVATLSESLGSTSEALLESAAEAQSLAEEQVKLNQQINAQGKKGKGFFRQAAANLEKSATSSNNS
jgi:hypothetical protein